MDEINLRQFKRGDQVAPHKPLLLLLAISRLQQGEPRLLTYQEIEPDMKELLLKYSKSAGKPHPEFPFWRLQKDMNGSLWEIPNADRVRPSAKDYVSPKQLIDEKIKGGLPKERYEEFVKDPQLAARFAQQILDTYFPESLHEDIKQDIGLLTAEYQQAVKRRRDPTFARQVLELYRYQCSICQYGARLGHAPMGIEAAHIKWHAYNGPDIPSNGLALCSTHHKAFDTGAMGLSDSLEILISKALNGSGPMQDMFYKFKDQVITLPSEANAKPGSEFIRWHRKEVFRG